MATAVRCGECGFLLPAEAAGARFCPGCGQPLTGTRRAAPSAWVEFLDQAWDFFASVKVAVVLILLIALGAAAGTLIEQESLYQDWRPPELYYPARYGPFWGPLFMKLGLTHAYTSTWFLTLVYLMVVSLVVCSLQRLVPLHRALSRPTVLKSPAFVRRQPIVGEVPLAGGAAGTAAGAAPPGGGADADPLAPLAAALRRRGFRVWREGHGLHADKGRLSRYGPYIIHIGLIICAVAAGLKAVPGWDVTRDLWVEEGQTALIPGTNLALRNDGFRMEFYPDGTVSLYETRAVLLEDGRPVREHAIRVNHPLQYRGWELYQASYRAEPGWVHLEVVETATGRPTGPHRVTVDLRDPAPRWDLGGGWTAEVDAYLPDAERDPETGQFVNRSQEIRNPLFRVWIYDPAGRRVGAQALLVSVRPGVEPPIVAEGPLALRQVDVAMRWYSGIKAHRDRTIPYMFFGLGVVVLGMAFTFFVFHRQVWAVLDGETVVVGARTNKNRYGAELELQHLLRGLGGRLVRGYIADNPGGDAGTDWEDPADLERTGGQA